MNLIIDRINKDEGDKEVPFVHGSGETRRDTEEERVSPKKKKQKKKKKRSEAPTASNSIPVVRERVINRVEIEEKG